MVNGFEAAVERHQRKVYTFARYYLGQTQEAEDITQEVFLKLWPRLWTALSWNGCGRRSNGCRHSGPSMSSICRQRDRSSGREP